jgi:hypothetical protein
MVILGLIEDLYSLSTFSSWMLRILAYPFLERI